jgi:hypothetical protein
MFASLSDLLPMSAASTLHMRLADSAGTEAGPSSGVIYTGPFGECARRLLQLRSGAYDQFWIESPVGRFSSYQIGAAEDQDLLAGLPLMDDVVQTHLKSRNKP